jgi:hypothetical protein
MKMKALLIPVLLLAVSFAGYNLSQQWGEARIERSRSDAQQARNDEMTARYQQILVDINTPKLPDRKEVALKILIYLRGKLATCETAGDAHAAAWEMRHYAETIRKTPLPVELISKIPGNGIGYDAQRYLEAFSEHEGEKALPAFQVKVKQLAAEIDAALPLLK